LRNLGRGHAAGLRVSLYQQDLDQLVWIEDRLHDVPELVAPGEVLSPVRRKNDWVRYAVQKSVCDLIVEGSYRTPLGEERQLRRAFKLGAIESDLYEVPPPVRGDKGVKVERIRKLLTGIESAYDITATGHCLALDVDGEDLVVHLMGGDGAVMAWNFSFGTSLRRIEADVQRGTQRHLGGDGGEAVHTDDPLPSG
jgi:hypothetical protein